MVRSAAASLDLRGGHPAVDLVNTVAWRGDAGRRTDYLLGYPDLVAWAHHAGVLSLRESQTLTRGGDEGAATRTLHRTRQLREALHRVWTGSASAHDGEVLAGAYRSALRARRLVVEQGAASWRESGLTTATPLHRLAVEAVTFLTATTGSLVKRCGDDECGWLFLDTSHRHNRRWCSAADCGNRARVRRFYERRSLGGRQLARPGG